MATSASGAPQGGISPERRRAIDFPEPGARFGDLRRAAGTSPPGWSLRRETLPSARGSRGISWRASEGFEPYQRASAAVCPATTQGSSPSASRDVGDTSGGGNAIGKWFAGLLDTGAKRTETGNSPPAAKRERSDPFPGRHVGDAAREEPRITWGGAIVFRRYIGEPPTLLSIL